MGVRRPLFATPVPPDNLEMSERMRLSFAARDCRRFLRLSTRTGGRLYGCQNCYTHPHPETETDVVKVNLAHRPGELARVAQKLGDASININHLYCGTEPNTNAPLIIFGVAEVGKAAPPLEQAAAAAGRG